MTEATRTRITRILFYALTVLVLVRVFFGIPRSVIWYAFISASVTGLTTYLGIIGYKIHKKPFFLKLNLVPLFVAFCFTAPLVELPDIINDLSRVLAKGGGVSRILDAIIADLAVGGQIFWLLFPIQIAMSIFENKNRYKVAGYIVFFFGIFGFFTYFVLLFTVVPIIEYFLK